MNRVKPLFLSLLMVSIVSLSHAQHHCRGGYGYGRPSGYYYVTQPQVIYYVRQVSVPQPAYYVRTTTVTTQTHSSSQSTQTQHNTNTQPAQQQHISSSQNPVILASDKNPAPNSTTGFDADGKPLAGGWYAYGTPSKH